MNRILNEIPSIAAVLVVGMVLGWWLSGSAAMWWLVMALFVLAIVCRVVQLVMASRRKTTATS